jgi:hypothetical protein
MGKIGASGRSGKRSKALDVQASRRETLAEQAERSSVFNEIEALRKRMPRIPLEELLEARHLGHRH